LDRRLGGFQSRSGRGGEEKNSQPPHYKKFSLPFIRIINKSLQTPQVEAAIGNCTVAKDKERPETHILRPPLVRITQNTDEALLDDFVGKYCQEQQGVCNCCLGPQTVRLVQL
jgi:hypothetical protein